MVLQMKNSNKIEKSNVIFVGPVPGVVTGQSMAFSVLINGTKHNSFVVNSDTQGYRFIFKVLRFFFIILKFIFLCALRKPEAVYVSCTRTLFGSVKDIILLYISNFLHVKKVCVHLHGLDLLILRSSLIPLHKKYLDKAYSKATDVIALHDSMLYQFNFVEPHVNRHVVRNFVTSDVLDLDMPVIMKKIEYRVLYLSNMMASKGVLDLVKAVSELVNDGYNARLICAGHYLDDSVMSALSLEHELEAYWSEEIRYHGPVYGKNKLDLLAWSNVFALPSYYSAEAFPLSIIEAMASGSYVIVSDHNILPEIVKPLNGAVVESNSCIELYECISSLTCQDINKTMIHNYHYARQYFTEDLHISSIDSILEV
jgi:glycosyltransferase involved in cell wall biosynthesis